MSIKIKNTVNRYSRCMNLDNFASESKLTKDQTSCGGKKNKKGISARTSAAPRKTIPRMNQFINLFLAAATFMPSPSTLTSARLPKSLKVRLFAHSESKFCGHAHPHQTVPIVM